MSEVNIEGEVVVHISRSGWNGESPLDICLGEGCRVERVDFGHYRLEMIEIEGVNAGFNYVYIPDDDEINALLPKPGVGMHDAAAFWGSAKSLAYPVEERLQLALAALEFFGGEYEKTEEVDFEPTRWRRVVDADGKLLAESSDEEEIRGIAKKHGLTPQRLFTKTIIENEWRDI